MSDRYANLSYNAFIVIYRPTLVSLFLAENKSVLPCWTYDPYVSDRVEKVIKKVVSINKDGVIIWEKDIKEIHSIHLRNFSNKKIFQTKIDYFVNDEQNLKPNDIVGCNEHWFLMDMTNKFGFGILDLASYKTGIVIEIRDP